MMNIIQLINGIIILFLIIPQTPTENIVLRKFNETGFFSSYRNAKSFVNNLTWLLILLFIVITFLLNFV
jgi:protein translocase SecG subunit